MMWMNVQESFSLWMEYLVSGQFSGARKRVVIEIQIQEFIAGRFYGILRFFGPNQN